MDHLGTKPLGAIHSKTATLIRWLSSTARFIYFRCEPSNQDLPGQCRLRVAASGGSWMRMCCTLPRSTQLRV